MQWQAVLILLIGPFVQKERLSQKAHCFKLQLLSRKFRVTTLDPLEEEKR